MRRVRREAISDAAARASEGTDVLQEDVRLLKSSEAADMLAISPRKLWELTKCGEIACVRVGRAVRYCRQDLAAWIESKRVVG